MVGDARALGLRLDVTRVQRASDWIGVVNVTTLACQKEPSSQFGHLLSHSYGPFPLCYIPNPGANTPSQAIITPA